MDGRHWCCLTALLAATVLTPSTSAQSPGTPSPGAQQTAYSQEARESLTFAAGRAVVGQRTEQTVEVKLALKTRSRQGAEVLEEADTGVTRSRRRVIVVAKVEQGLATAAHVQYLASKVARADDSPEPDAIDGKRYYCERQGDSIRVLALDGKTPPLEEFELVAENMETLGKPNPLAEFLAGKRVEVGQTLTVPPKVAQQLVGLNSDLGDVTRFELTLKKIVQDSGRTCGQFFADLEAQRSDSSQLRLIISGPMLIDAESSRAVGSELSGPIGMSQSIADPRGRLQVESTGKLSMRVASRFQQPRSGG